MLKNKNMIEFLTDGINSGKGISIVEEKNNQVTFLTYQELFQVCSCFSQYLQEKNVSQGTQVIIYCKETIHFIYSFWSCLIGGFQAVPVDGRNKMDDKGFWMRFAKEATILTDREDIFEDKNISLSKILISKNILNLYKTRTDYLKKHIQGDMSYIQYSSGTTNRTKGIQVSQKNVVADAIGLIERLQVVPEDVFLSWQPLTHCFGLIVYHILPIIAGCNQYLIPTDLFMENPMLWIKKASQYQATRLGMIPFAMKHFMDVEGNSPFQPEVDLSRVKSILIGGELITNTICEKFSETLSKYGLRENVLTPVYGLAECTTIASLIGLGECIKHHKLRYSSVEIGARPQYCEDGEEGIDIVETGKAVHTVSIQIKDDNGQVLEQGRIGHINLKGEIVAKGYLEGPEADKNVFLEDGSLETGDIGFLSDDALVVIGREKEIVVKYGKKYLCSDLENYIKETILRCKDRRVVACSGISKFNQVEEVVIFLEAKPWEITEMEGLEQSIKDKLYRYFGLSVDYVVPVEHIPVTYSGKIRRLELMSQFVKNREHEHIRKAKVPVDSKSDNREHKKIADKIAGIIEALLGIRISDYDSPFKDYGIVSVNIPRLIEKVNGDFGVTLQPSELFNHPNVNEFAKFVKEAISTEKKMDEREKDMRDRYENDKIAIVGMSCRFPGGANSVSEFWDILCSGEDAISEIPESRWKLEEYYSEADVPGKMYNKCGGFLNVPIDEFDAKFFNISPKESVAMDPQQRLLLELVWESFENAELKISDYQKTNTGVFLGISTDEYALSHIYSGDPERIDAYSLTGMCKSTACGRISYTFGFEGPCVAVDTACSSTLTALHFACSSIQAEEADMAVVAGVNLNVTPVTNIGFSKLQATSRDGRSKSFDESANGYGRGEGGGVLLLKRLEDAKRDNNRILGVICGSLLNQDGKSNGLTAPNGESQKKLVQGALKKTNLDPNDVDYIEMHGTGTKLGDPIEVNAIIDTYCKNRTNTLKIGSVKSNIGHLEAAAGIASIMKVLLCFQHDMIPGNLHFNNPNPFISWDTAPIQVVSQNTEWKKEGGIRRVGINGFGFGGSNAHVIIEEYKPEPDHTEEAKEEVKECVTCLLKLSAKTEKSLKEYANKYLDFIKNTDEEELPEILARTNSAKEDFDCRMAISCQSKEELLKKLSAYVEGTDSLGVYTSMEKNSPVKRNRKVAFMFTGQGSQYVNMGKDLYESNTVFHDCMDQCNKLFKPLILQSITGLLYGERTSEELVERTVNAQPLIFSIEYSLAKMWESLGVTPSLVMGHSIGEFAAAVSAGILSLQDAVKVVAIRGRLMDSVSQPGGMGAIFATEEEVKKMIESHKDTVSIAVVNGVKNCVISGNLDHVKSILAEAQAAGIRAKQLKVSQGFHSVLMNEILDEFEELISDVKGKEAEIPFMSALYARPLAQGEILDARYWTRHIAEKVSFYQTVKAIEAPEQYVFLEIGSNTVLSSLCREILGSDQVVVGSMRMRIDDKVQLSNTLAELYANGVDINWKPLYGFLKQNETYLPTYPFDRVRYWQEPVYDCKALSTISTDDKNFHKLLGQKIESAALGKSVFYRRNFTATSPYFMSEHIIFDTAISPAAAHVSLLLSAAYDLKRPKSVCISNMEMRTPLAVAGEEEREVQILIGDSEISDTTYEIVSRDMELDEKEWVSHTHGNINVSDEYFESPIPFDLGHVEELIMDTDSDEIVYNAMSDTGFDLGIGFRRITKNYYKNGEAYCYIEPLETVPDLDMYELYPGIIDSLFQTMLCIHYKDLKERGIAHEEKTIIPYFIGSVTYNYIQSDNLWCCVDINKKDDTLYGDVTAFNEKGEVVIAIKNFMAQFTTRDVLLKSLKTNHSKLKYSPVWREQKQGKEDDKNTAYVIVSNDCPLAEAVSEELERSGKTVLQIALDKDLETQLADLEHRTESLSFIYMTGGENGNLEQIDSLTVRKVVEFTKALGNAKVARKSKLKFVTTQIQGDTPNILDAPVWGFAKVMCMEYSGLFGGMIDVTKQTPVKAVCQEIVADRAEEIRLDEKGKTYASRLVKLSANKEASKIQGEPIEVREDASYLITGGNGAVGIVYATALIEKGAKSILLMGRSSLSKKAEELKKQVEKDGVQIAFVKGDVCDRESMKQAVKAIKDAKYPELKGIIHAAGILQDGMISESSWSDFRNVLAPKVAGAWNVYQETKDYSLDFFIMTSSITSILGNMGQSSYAAANYFMNTFATWLQKQGVKGYAMCWGPWEDGGMASADNKDATANMDGLGIHKFATEDGKQLILDFMDKPYTCLFLADIQWNKLAEGLMGKGKQEMLSELVTRDKNADSSEAAGQALANAFYEELKNMNPEEREATLVAELQRRCGEILGFDSSSVMSSELSLREQGADSLMLFQIRTCISKLLNIELDIAVLYNYVSIDALAHYLLTEAIVFEGDAQSEAAVASEEELQPESEGSEDTESLFNQLKELIEE